MNILICIPTLADGKGGSERVAAELGVAMRKRGHTVSYAFKNSPGHYNPQYPVYMDSTLLRYNDSLTGMREFRGQIRALNPDIIMIFYANWQVYELYDALRDLGISLCYRECSNPERVLGVNWTNASNAWQMRNDILESASGICVMQAQYAASFPDNLQPLIQAIPNACKRSPRFSTDGKSNTILHVGAAKKNKNPEVMLDAFILLASHFPDWKLLLCTTAPPHPKPEYEAFKNRIEKEIPPGRVILLENVEDMGQLYTAANIHCITSMSEGLPNCVCEAMSVGVPSVGFTDSVGTNLLIRNGVNGLLSDSSPEALAAALEALIVNPGLARALGEQAWHEAAKFDPEAIYDQWENFFKSSLERFKRRGCVEEPANIASMRTPWEEITQNTWRIYLENRIKALTGEVIFYGCGNLYKGFKHLFSHMQPVCVLLDKKIEQDEIDGLKILTPNEIDNRLKTLPVAIFSKDAKVIEHRLRSEYGIDGEIICIDRRILRDKYLPGSPHPVTQTEVQERFKRMEEGKPAYNTNEKSSQRDINTEYPDCAFCGSNKTLPYMTSEIIPWYGDKKFTLVRCERCGLIYNSPRPPETCTLEDVNKFGDWSYEHKLNIPDVQAIHDLYAKELLLQKPDAKKIFDVAFGAGTLLHSFKKLGLEASGNEVNAFACQKLASQGFDVFNTPTRELKLDRQFDIITMLDYLEHTYTPFDDLLKVHSMLKKDGILYLKTLDMSCASHLRKGELWQLFSKRHFYYFLPEVLAGMIENAGFEILNIRRNSLIHVLGRKV